MIFGHGVDIVDVKRIKKAVEGNQRFLSRVFTETEIAYCNGRKECYASFAARFAAKEAFLKALGTGLTHGINLTDIEVNVRSGGEPCINLYNKAKDCFTERQFTQINLSMSHTNQQAIASVIIC